MSTAEIKAYLARIGAKGGEKSRRKLTKAQAKAMAAKRWQKSRKSPSVEPKETKSSRASR